MNDPQTYHVELHFEEDHIWAQVVELPNCFATGRDMEELSEALTESLNMCLGENSVQAVKIEPKHRARAIPARIELVPC